MESFPMKQMIVLSIGFHLLFFTCSLFIHYFKWKQPQIRPRVLSVQLVTLPQPDHVEKKVEEKAHLPGIPLPGNKKMPSPRAKALLRPSAKALIKVPKQVFSQSVPVPFPKIEKPVPKPAIESKEIEAKKEKPLPMTPIPEPQKIEIAPISSIDPDYTERVKRKIEGNWNPAPFTGMVKEVILSFVIIKSGLVKMPQVVRSSGDPYFDNAARRAVLESRSFGPLPPDYTNLSVEITCSFTQNKGS